MIVDAHGHYTTVPAGLRVFRALQIFEEHVKAAYPGVAPILEQRRKEKSAGV